MFCHKVQNTIYKSKYYQEIVESNRILGKWMEWEDTSEECWEENEGADLGRAVTGNFWENHWMEGEG